MSTVILPPTIPEPDEIARFDGVTWDEYIETVDELHQSRRVRTAYREGLLEIATNSLGHQRASRLLAQLITLISLQSGIDIVAGGSSTLRSKHLKRGAEPDECYWLANAIRVIGIKRWNAQTNPPPDLVIEVDTSSDSLNRRPIYATLGIPEMWRFDGQTLQSFALNKDGEYVPTEKSLAFEFLNVADLLPFLAQLGTRSDTAILREFQVWCATLATARFCP